MKVGEIQYLKTTILAPLVNDYISDNLPSDINFKYPEEFDFLKKIEEKKQFPHREIVASVLREQYKNCKQYEKVNNNIDLLKNNNTFTITTGHQLCIFLGPLYVIYKIIHCIKLTDELNKRFKQFKFIPIFWLASEDHDTEEINHIYIHNNKITWNPQPSVPAGKLNTTDLKNTIEILKNTLGISNETDSLITLFENAYLKNENLADATRFLINELFGNYGIIAIDGNNKELKKLFTPLFKKECNDKFIERNVYETNKFILKHNYKIQANPRSCNIFFLNNYERTRIDNNGNNFLLAGTTTSYTTNEILKLIDNFPEKFSPNVLMRPLYQETILPNIATIGGAGEVAYWMELKNVFNEINLPFPILVLRSSIVLLDKKILEKIKKMNFEIKDFFEDEEIIIKKYLQKNNANFKSESPLLQTYLDDLKISTLEIDASLETAISATIQRIQNELDNFEKKITRAIKQKQETQINQIKNIKEKIYPNNSLQERSENFSSFYIKNRDTFFDAIYDSIDISGKNIGVCEL